MIQLAILDDEETLWLEGNGASAPFGRVASRVTQGRTSQDPSARVTDIMDLILIGEPAEIDRGLSRLERVLTHTRESCSGAIARQVSLCQQATLGEETWQARVVDGWLELLGAGVEDRLRGSMGVRLHLVRLNFWEGTERSLPLANALFPDTMGGLTLYNPVVYVSGLTFAFDGLTRRIVDNTGGLEQFTPGTSLMVSGSPANSGAFTVKANSSTWVEVAEALTTEPAGARIHLSGMQANLAGADGGTIEGDLPAPARLEITNLSQSIVSQIWVGAGSGGRQALCFEGEAADQAAPIAGEWASGLRTAPVSWNSDQEICVFRWRLNPTDQPVGPGTYQALAHFHAPLPVGLHLRLRWADASGFFPGGGLDCPTDGSMLVWLGPLDAPDLCSIQGVSGDYRLELWGRGLPPVDMDLDFVLLLPADGFRFYEPRETGLPGGWRLVDDGETGQVYTCSDHDEIYDLYRATGVGVELVPGRRLDLGVLCSGASGDVDVLQRLSLRVVYRPRRGVV